MIESMRAGTQAVEWSTLRGDHSGGSKYDYSERLKQLNPQQKQAVFHQHGVCLVNSVPGSGKTMALTMRFIRLVRTGVEPDRILCCTFTKKSAVEMKERIMAGVQGRNLYAPYIGTMHSLFYRMLHDDPRYYSLERIPVATRYFSKMKHIIASAKDFGDKIKEIDVGSLFRMISNAKNELMSPDDLRESLIKETGINAHPVGAGCNNVWDYYKEYEKRKQENREIDYDDMIYQTWYMFTTYPEILDKWQRAFDFILVDEFQDINTAQWEVIKLLASVHWNLFVVGDANQSIYRFRGSKPEFLYNLKREIPNVRIINMVKNYRSGEAIINVANSIIRKTEYYMAEIESVNEGGQVYYNHFTDEEDQAEHVVKCIKELVEHDVNPERIGIIYRTNSCSAMLEVQLAHKNIRFRSKSGDGFFGSKIVKDMMAYLKASIKVNCESELSRIINVPNRYLGMVFRTHWEKIIEEYEVSPKQALLMDYEKNHWKTNASELYYYLEALSSLSDRAEKAVQYIRKDVGYEEWIGKNDENINAAKHDLMNELEYVAEKAGDVPQLLKMSGDVLKNEAYEDAVTLMTVHGAKGSEYKYVFFVSLINGIIPHSKSAGEEGEQEERRMFYVGITRAESELYLSSFDVKILGGETAKGREPSKFLSECNVI